MNVFLLALADGGLVLRSLAALPGVTGDGGGGFNWHDFIVQALGFGVLAIALVLFVVPVLRRMAAERTKGIADEFARLERELSETAQKLADTQQKLATISAETQKRIQAAQDEGTRTRANLLAEAQGLARAELEKARRDVQMERDKAVLELRAAVTEMTVAATGKVIGAVMSDAVHGRMVEKTVGELDRTVRTS